MGPGRFPLARKRARGAGMTCGKRRDSPCARGVAAKLIPAPPPACHPARVAACDGTWMGPFTNLTWQRPAPGRRANGSRSRRPAVTVAVAAPAMARAYGDRRRHMAARASKGQTAAADLQQDTNRRTRAPQGSPGTRAGSQGARRGSQEGLPRPSGPVRTRPWVADEAPAFPSHPRPSQHHGRRGRTARAL
jgi:hypothetical protein